MQAVDFAHRFSGFRSTKAQAGESEIDRSRIRDARLRGETRPSELPIGGLVAHRTQCLLKGELVSSVTSLCPAKVPGLLHRFAAECLLKGELVSSVTSLCLAKVPGPFHRFTAECLLCGELVVSAAANSEVRRFVAATQGARMSVVELEEGARVATPAFGRDVRALHAVAVEDRSASGVRDAIARFRPGLRRRSGTAFRPFEAGSLELD